MTLPLASLSHGDTYKVDAHTKAVEKLLDQVPDGATVEANVGPISRLVHRTTVYWVGNTPGVNPDYIVIDNSSGWVSDPVTYAKQRIRRPHTPSSSARRATSSSTATERARGGGSRDQSSG